MTERCACGLPLHYKNPVNRERVEALVKLRGPSVIVTVGRRRYLVQRHYIALHGLKAADLPDLASRGIVSQVRTAHAVRRRPCRRRPSD